MRRAVECRDLRTDQLDWVVTERAAEPASLVSLQQLGILASAV